LGRALEALSSPRADRVSSSRTSAGPARATAVGAGRRSRWGGGDRDRARPSLRHGWARNDQAVPGAVAGAGRLARRRRPTARCWNGLGCAGDSRYPTRVRACAGARSRPRERGRRDRERPGQWCCDRGAPVRSAPRAAARRGGRAGPGASRQPREVSTAWPGLFDRQSPEGPDREWVAVRGGGGDHRRVRRAARPARARAGSGQPCG
jgi:hypothetical protein